MKLSKLKLKKLAIRFLQMGPIEDYIDKDWFFKNISQNTKMITDLAIIPSKELMKNQEMIKDISLIETKDLAIVPCKDLIENQEITGIIYIGAFQYADPAYDFRYMYGESQKSLETGYGKQFDKTFLDRQFFYCICMFLMGATQPELSWVSSEQNVKRLKKLIACRHMEEAYR